MTYSNRSKVDEIGVEPGLLERAGAVSEEVAAAVGAENPRLARDPVQAAHEQRERVAVFEAGRRFDILARTVQFLPRLVPAAR